jgi:[methyl-Co(III) methanol-specific corrinoid protein]:coenzyme M methyltransferase
LFGAYAAPYLKRLVDAIHEAGVPAIVHICGKIGVVEAQFKNIGADVISVDAMVSMAQLKNATPDSGTMGNLNTFVLDSAAEDKIRHSARRLIEAGVDVISPACGLSMSTPVRNIRAMTDEVKRGFE